VSATDTPRTDKIAHRGYVAETYCAAMTDLARNLERELNAAKEALAMSERVLKLSREAREKADADLNEAKNEIARLNGQTRFLCRCCGGAVLPADEVRIDRKTLTALRDYLKPKTGWPDFDSNGEPRTTLGLLFSNLNDALQQP
jgi:hypothetical protein